ncbi:endonuclease/exonuclease/phosphatase family protein [Bergeyella sp. RCAD1439]|uniref:endonuclease/exonuclease/phosphatase family protein n=1 Tax=Bergeyella anatis TaxID=3113737 RepID=UPI002E17FBDD|nr:endonuclease/exonuclease/phosphatase family protein [Bergeyella sp. RCAD1439]
MKGWAKISLFGVHLVVSALLLANFLNAYVPPSVFPLFNFLPFLFPFLFGVHLGLFFLWVWRKKRKAWFFVPVTLCCLLPMQRYFNLKGQSEGEREISVMTYNVEYNNHEFEDEIEAFLLKHEVDVLFLQEPDFMDLRDIETGGYTAIKYPLVGLYTKHKVLRQARILDDSEGWVGDALYADIEIDGRVFRFINVYLESFTLEKSRLGLSSSFEENRSNAFGVAAKMLPVFKIHQLQIEKIYRYIEHSPYPVILGGDFNAVPNSYEYYRFRAVLQDPFELVGRGSGASFYELPVPLRIDYVFCSSEFKPVDYTVNTEIRFSDHYPVRATFRVSED